MATTIVTKNSSTAAAVPTAAQLVQGELAVNVADKRLFTENNAGAVVELGTNPSALTVTGEITANGGIALGDNDKATFGDSDDLQVYHDGNHSYISEQGTGNLRIYANDLVLANNDGSQTFLYGQNGGPVSLSYANNSKLTTTSTGIDVTGTATMDGLSSDGNIQVVGAGNTRTIGFNYFGSSKYNFYMDGTTDADKMFIRRGTTNVANFASNGDISFYEDTGTTAKLFWDASAESLTLGSGGSEGTLNVGGAASSIVARFTDATTSSVVVRPESGGAIIGTDGGGTLHLASNGSTLSDRKMTILASGNVGIGTSSPSAQLHLVKAGGTLIKLGTSVNTSEIEAREVGGGQSLILSSVNSADHLVIDGAGNVGIGTTSPFGRLSVDVAAGAPASSGNMTNGFTVHNSNGGRAIQLGVNESGSYNYLQSSYVNNANVAVDMAFFTGSNERMRIDSSGNLLVGKTSSSIATAGTAIRGDNPGLINSVRNGVILELNRLSTDGDIVDFFKDGTAVGSIGTVDGDLLIHSSASGHKGLRLGNGYVAPTNNAGTTEDNTTDLGLSSQRFKDLHLSGTIHKSTGTGTFKVETSGSSSANLEASNTLKFTVGDSDSHQFINGSSEVARIDSSGNLLVGGTSTLGKVTVFNGVSDGLYVTGTGTGYVYTTSNTTSLAGYFATSAGGAGSISLSGTTTSYNTSSDQRLKENIADADDAGSKIDAIQVRKYNWKADGSHQDYGMIAQELQAVAPEAVSGDADSEEMMGVDYSKLVPMLIKEIQSLRNRVAQLETGE